MADVTEILSRGLSAARLRVNILASNIANAETTRTPEGGPYKRKDVVQMAVPIKEPFSEIIDNLYLAKPVVTQIVEDQSPPRKVYQPGHPDADKDGFVSYPNINVVETMTDLMTAIRLYEANVSAMEAARDMGRAASRIALRF
ncbi:MAG: flagellar basal body rod protein FlgC [Candidatus Dadabacteria bacterium]|nr:MAG: flagellar basal body rod protein FlgC [Candidatus Dadabacteria bacterium]